MTPFQIAAVSVAIAAMLSDVRTRRIPNALTFGAALAALVAQSYAEGWSGAGSALAGWAVGVAFFFPVFALGGMGAGDVKLLGALGAWVGPLGAVWVALYAGIAGGVMGLVVAAYAGYLGRALRNIWGLLLFWRVAGVSPLPELTLSKHNGPRLAYAIPVFTGLVVTIWQGRVS